MKSTKEHLKDPRWWDEYAPEGYDFLIVDNSDGFTDFYRHIDDIYYNERGHILESLDDDFLEVYTRPEPEWQPKVGDVCLARAYENVWHEVELLKLGKEDMWVCYRESNDRSKVFFSKDLKPIPTPREKFVEKASKRFNFREDQLFALYDLAMEFK